MAREMEIDGDSNKLKEVIQSTPETDPVPSPSRKRKVSRLSGDGATLKELSADEAALWAELSKWEEEGVRAVEQIMHRQKRGLDVEGRQVLHSMIDLIKQTVQSVMYHLKFIHAERNINIAQSVDGGSESQSVDGGSESQSVDGGSESSSLADDDDDKVGAMEFDTSAIEEQASGNGDGVKLEREDERLAPVAADDDDEEEPVGLGLALFDTTGDPTPTTKSGAKLDEMDRGKSSEQLAEEADEMAIEEEDFTEYTRIWEYRWGSNGCGSFADHTTLSSMHFAHLTPGYAPSDPGRVDTTVQVYSIKLSEIKGGLQWPLRVYGMVAVRDTVDHNRNVLFNRHSSVCQIVTEDDPYLCLIGPSRAIVFSGGVDVEIQLKLGASPISRDRSLITDTQRYCVGYDTISFENCFCTTELRVQPIEYSVQATVLGIRVKEGLWPSLYGGIVYCFATPHGETEQEDQKLVLQDFRGRGMLMSLTGYLHLSRHVVSVGAQSCLKLILQTYSSSSGDIGESSSVCFEQRFSNISRMTCSLGGTEVEITVAWSRLVGEKGNITMKGYLEMGMDD